MQTICRLVDERLGDGFDHSSLITFVKDRPGHDRRYAVNADKIKNDLGWTPSIQWDEGFKATLNWYLDNEAWWRPLVDEKKFGKRLGHKS